MAFADDLRAGVRSLIQTPFKMRTGRVIPSELGPHDYVTLFDTSYLYTDMADSSGLAERFEQEEGARILRVFLNVVCRVIRDRGGEIRSFDGDRVMGIFLGEDAADKAVDAALRITWAVSELAHDELLSYKPYLDQYVDNGWKLRHRTGIDLGWARVVRGGVRDYNDLVSIGYAPNAAAKLSDYKGGGTTMITDKVYENLSYKNIYAKNSRKNDGIEHDMWDHKGLVTIGSRYEEIYTSTWWRSY
ncbi:adenylate/guanylate cyclase domain-containing protein [Gordonia rubripertincta]|uniref:adenylate/guanylate cyclase domain-containing protein n=1 Tax=Gordonia rubripertincta TaxID=36822 RepID=UPI00117D85F0|nr:adenylate/guanylate cyclase domain-containing protein [Gordonia rubripertincta]TSD93463.1 adenylate/guanylate cyclase domain-containing protein [Gordonia rubripertincta]